MAGRVVLYSDAIYTLKRPDSSRPQAARSRVDTRGAVWKPHCGWSGGSGCIAIISTRTIGDLPDSDLWSGRSCIIARQQVEAGTAGRPQAAKSRVACAERCGDRTAAGRAGRAVLRYYLYALSKTCQTPIYGLASRVALRGSKRQRALPAASNTFFRNWPV